MIITHITIIIIVVYYKYIIYSYLFITISLIFENDQSLYRATISPHFVAIVNSSYPIIIEFTPVKNTRYVNELTEYLQAQHIRRFSDL